MLPATLVTLATFLLEICTTSPVYNMQPAFITANIGTNGRNIRNLPCISRKNNQSGVCMFAIDCLKSNGTHLGTCIDRFYFGSCCHIEPVHDLADNTIDITDIIPAREPPNRLASTAKPVLITTALTSKPSTLNQTSFGTTTTERVVTSQKITRKNSTITTSRPEADPKTTVSYKLTTFQSVDETTTPRALTTSPTTLSTTSTTTRKSTFSTKATLRPKPTKTSSKPTKTTSATTKRTKPTTKRPITQKPTKKTAKPGSGTTKSTSKTTTTRPTTVTTKKPVILTAKPITKPPVVILTTQSTVRKNVTQVESGVNLATNEIETGTTSASTAKPSLSTAKPSIVTWTVAVDDGRNTTTASTTISSSTVNISTTSEDWLPITTPDGWVLLPSVPGEDATQSPSTSTPTSTSASITNVTTGTSGSAVSSTTATITVSNASSTTEEAASQPSITYIPLDVTTSSPAANATAALNTNATNATSSSPAGVTTTTPVNNATTTQLEAATTTSSVVSDPKPVNMSDFTNVCGRRMYPEARIVGGEKASFGKWPWQISLRQWRTSTYLHKCGAALLNENWAITAAHCVDNVPPSDLLLRLGEHDLSTESEPYLHQERRVQIVASHPQFDPRTFEYDLALLRFYEPVAFQPNILPVCVPQNDENFVGRTAHVTGWGRLYEDGPLPSVLQEVSVPVINNSVCESMYRAAGYIEHIPHIFICAGWRRGGFDSCEGDSGGPMVIQREDKRFLLAGVISWGIGCAEPNQPGVYTRISEFRDWINQILQF